MKNILFFYPSNKRSNQIETTLIELKKLGHEIKLLTTCQAGDLHARLAQEGIEVFAHPTEKKNSLFYYLDQILFLIRFCKKNKIDLLFGNLQHANFIAIWAQFFIKAKLIAFRHHFKFSGEEVGIAIPINATEQLFDRWINRLAPTIVVPSPAIKENILRSEKVSSNKIKVIPYLYDFTDFKTPSQEEVQKVQDRFPAQLRLVMISRLIPFKRHHLVFPVFKQLIDEGYDLKVMVLDEGPEKEKLQLFIDQNQLQEHIFLLSFQKDPMVYLKASDLLIHPSITEASSNVAKEAGFLSVSIAACKEVGDFREYLIDGENSFFLDLAKPQLSLIKILKEVYQEPQLLKDMGKRLNETVTKKFGSNDQALADYQSLIEEYS